MYKNFSVIIFIITVIYIIYAENYYDKAYYLPSQITIGLYMYFVPPLITSFFLDISKKIFKNKIAQRIILALNILALCYTILLIIFTHMMHITFSNW